jgi:hypothetical protein
VRLTVPHGNETGCYTWTLTLREDKVRVFENRVLRRIYGGKREEVLEDWKMLHSEGFHDSVRFTIYC